MLVNRKLGALRDPIDFRDYKFKKKTISFPIEFSLDCGKNIKDQDSIGSCVAQVTSEILEYFQGNNTQLSTNFIYGIHKKLFGSNGPGMFLREACKIVKDYGDPSEKYCKGNTEVEEVYQLAEDTFNNKEAMEDAQKHTISKYAKVKSDNDIKYALMNYSPILTSIKWYSGNTVNKKTGLLTKGEGYEGLHSIMIYGWNEEGWICQNSWGKTWGKKGNFILPFNYGIYVAYSFIKSEEKEDIKIPTKNKFSNFIYKCINWIINLVVDLF